MTDAGAAVPRGAASQTLSRGIQILEVLADASGPLTIDEVARRLDVHRSVAYRLLRTLEDHRLVVRDATGRATLGPRMAALAAGVRRDLQSAALPELTSVADDLAMTCFLAVLDGEECVTLWSVEPRRALASVAQRPGTRHPVSAGAPGRAILSLLPADEWPVEASSSLREEVVRIARRGFATSRDEVIPGVRSVAVPLSVPGQPPAAVAVVHVAGSHDEEGVASRLARACGAIRASFGD